jgi:hypothetical protein
MPLDKNGKGRRITAIDEVIQQLSISQNTPVPQKHRPAKVAEDLAHLAGRHVVSLVGRNARRLPLIITATTGFDTLFRSLECGGSSPLNFSQTQERC